MRFFYFDSWRIANIISLLFVNYSYAQFVRLLVWFTGFFYRKTKFPNHLRPHKQAWKPNEDLIFSRRCNIYILSLSSQLLSRSRKAPFFIWVRRRIEHSRAHLNVMCHDYTDIIVNQFIFIFTSGPVYHQNFCWQENNRTMLTGFWCISSYY